MLLPVASRLHGAVDTSLHARHVSTAASLLVPAPPFGGFFKFGRYREELEIRALLVDGDRSKGRREYSGAEDKIPCATSWHKSVRTARGLAVLLMPDAKVLFLMSPCCIDLFIARCEYFRNSSNISCRCLCR